MNALLKKILRYLRIISQFMRVGIVRKSQFRVEFFSQVIMDLIWYFTHILVFEFLYLHTDSIAGWNREEIRVFLGFLFVSDAFMMACLGQNWHFADDLKNGNLDTFRVKPASTIFLYFFQRFSPEGFTNLLFALSYLFYALFQKISFSPQTWVWLLWAILLSWWGRTIIVVFFSTIEFYILNSELSRFFSEVYMSIEDRPLDIFPKRLRAFFIYILPVGLLSYIPACMLLGRIAWQTCLGFTLWLFFLGCLIFKFWNYSFRRYESALG